MIDSASIISRQGKTPKYYKFSKIAHNIFMNGEKNVMSKKEINKLLDNYIELEKQEKEVKNQKEKIKAAIIKEMKSAELIETGSYKVMYTSYDRSGFDTKAFRETHKRLFEKFQTFTTCFKFTVSEV